MRSDRAWVPDGLCREPKHKGVNFAPEDKDKLGIYRAKAVCQQCPVQGQCFDYAMRNREPIGIWGGRTERERRALLPKRPRKGGKQRNVVG